ncbi:hypothetical protein AAKU55_005268 [Oxalobacteraceae bacterium GrIS 1.11]
MSGAKITCWRAIEKDYRAGIKSLRTIAGENDVAESTIRKRAARDGWARDLTAKIKSKQEEMLHHAVVSTLDAASEREVVEVNAQVQTNIILAHRTDIERTRRLGMALLEELEIATSDNQLLRELADMMYSPDKNGVDKLNELYTKIIAMPGRVDAMKKMADTLKTLIGLEREAFGIGVEGKKEEGGVESFLKRLASTDVDFN